ncbi:hypothetical protein P175DRAFT_0561303 [Aspergillus ochraceoroseus IBT 24754]|uniref:Uncharacterized protein n=1 Tax=Aspergillus ochraceoroseus IBT 24754 TaxID=1392256 RepID=A0A2T5LKS7_9EURO|nr:uncharacterized protein P175DRAFT_0561303 [Aspergillus ochraceoroseus IBT 24754]PTU16880.1 hypothetical protein P175DRAFT_0561303 [Aspergillus ochraceoroseus IBT 24754]
MSPNIPLQRTTLIEPIDFSQHVHHKILQHNSSAALSKLGLIISDPACMKTHEKLGFTFGGFVLSPQDMRHRSSSSDLEPCYSRLIISEDADQPCLDPFTSIPIYLDDLDLLYQLCYCLRCRRTHMAGNPRSHHPGEQQQGTIRLWKRSSGPDVHLTLLFFFRCKDIAAYLMMLTTRSRHRTHISLSLNLIPPNKRVLAHREVPVSQRQVLTASLYARQRCTKMAGIPSSKMHSSRTSPGGAGLGQ